jgi:Bacterial Ig domain
VMAVARAMLGVGIVLTLPGVLIALLLRMRLSVLTTWAAIPVFSIGAVFVLGEFTNLVRAPFGVPAFALFVAALALGVLVRRRTSHGEDAGREIARQDQNSLLCRDPRRLGDDPLDQTSSDQHLKPRVIEPHIAAALLVLGIVIGVLTWWPSLRAAPSVPPAGDAVRHGLMVARIERAHTFDTSKVLVSDVTGTHPAWNFYPLGLHASAAIAVQLAGAKVGAVLVALSFVCASIVFPLGMFVLARFLAPDRPLIAGFTAVLAPAIFPYVAFGTGDIPLVCGLSMVPVSVVLLVRALVLNGSPSLLDGRSLEPLLAAALALLTAWCLHSTNLPLIVSLALLLIIEHAWRARHLQALLDAARRGLAVAALSIAMFAPSFIAFVRGISDRSEIAKPLPHDAPTMLRLVVSLELGAPLRQYFLVVLAVSGALIWLALRRPAWCIAWATIVALAVFASISRNRLVHDLTFPWYRESARVTWNQMFFVPFFAGLTLAFAVSIGARVLRAAWVPILATIVALVVFARWAGLPAYRSERSYLDEHFVARSLLSQAQADASADAAFKWLRGHAGPKDTVVSEPVVDGSGWMYAQDGVKPLLSGIEPCQRSTETCWQQKDRETRVDWRDRVYLLQNIEQIGSDRIDRLMDKYDARWIYLNERVFPGMKRVLSLDAIRRNRHFVEVFRRHSVHVFQVAVNGLEVVDSTPPTTSIARPHQPRRPLSGVAPLAARASDNVALSKVEFYLTGGIYNNALIGVATQTYVGWIYNWNTASVPNGAYALNSVAVDYAGNVGRSGGVNVAVQN